MYQSEAIKEDIWRTRIDIYAQVMSRGQWIPYKWLVYALRKAQLAIMRGNARVILCVPPRHGKSESFSYWLPAWFLDLFSNKRVIFTCYGSDLALDSAIKVRNTFIDNEWSWTKVRDDRKRIDDWQTTDGGGMRSVGILGGITGKGADLLIIDDPHKDEFESPATRKKVINAFKSTLYTRLEPGASIIVIQTRWYQNDLAGWLMSDHDDNWEMIRFPAIAEEEDVLGRKIGEALCPERWPLERLLQIKKSIGSYRFAGLYQQRPAPVEGGIIKKSWLNEYDDLPDCDDWLQGWDLTFGDTGDSFVVGQVWARKDADFFLVDQIRDRIDFPSTLKAIERLTNKWPRAVTKVIENKANGPAVISTLKNKISGVVPYSPQGSKEARLAAVSGLFEAGNVHIPRKAEWKDDFVEEITVFPNYVTDDQVDACSMSLYKLSLNSNTGSFTLPEVGLQSNPWSFANA